MRGPSIRERRRIVASLAATIVVLVSLATAPGALAAPILVVAPSSGVAGATVTASASGFPAGSTTFRWDNGQLLGTVSATAQGDASLAFEIPSGAAPGVHFVRACSSNKCPHGNSVAADANVTVLGATPAPSATPGPTSSPAPTAPPTAPPSAGPTPGPTPHVTPKPTPRPSSGSSTPRPPGVTPEPTEPPAPTGDLETASPGTIPSDAPTAGASSGAASPGATSGVVAPVTARPGASAGPLPAGPASERDPFANKLLIPVAAILALVLAGVVFSRVRGGSRQAATGPADAEAGASGHAGAGEAAGLEPELYSAFADPVAPFLEPVPHAEDPDPWANAKTIAIHVEQVDEPRD